MEQIRLVGKDLDCKGIRRIRGFQPDSFFSASFFSHSIVESIQTRAYPNFDGANREENWVKFKTTPARAYQSN